MDERIGGPDEQVCGPVWDVHRCRRTKTSKVLCEVTGSRKGLVVGLCRRRTDVGVGKRGYGHTQRRKSIALYVKY